MQEKKAPETKSGAFRFFMIFFLSILLLLSALCGCGSSADSFEITAVDSYREIPGVTEEEIQAIEALKQSRSYLTYAHLTQTEAFELPDGSYSGFTIKLCELLTELFGIEFRSEVYENFSTMLSDIETGRADFNGDLTPTPERREMYCMSQSIAERSLSVYYMPDKSTDASSFETEADLSGMRLGFLKGTITAQFIRNSYPQFAFEEVPLGSLSEIVKALAEGEVDAFIGDAVMDPSYVSYGIRSRKLFPLVYTPVSMITGQDELVAIISVFSKYIEQGGYEVLDELYAEGEKEYIVHKLNSNFTDEEKAYIAAHSGDAFVRTAYEHDNYPVSFYNETAEEYQGIAVDILKEISGLTGLNFTSVVPAGTPWSEYLELLRTGEASIITELLRNKEREGVYLWSSKPCVTSQYALISKTDFPDVSPHQVPRYRVGIMGGSAYEDLYRTIFPDADNLIEYPHNDDVFAALDRDEVDMVMAIETLLLMQINYREQVGYKINLYFGHLSESYFGFNLDEVLLRSIIEKTFEYVDIETISSDWLTRSFDYESKLMAQRSEMLAAFLFVLIALLIFVVFLFIRNKRSEEQARIASKAKSDFLSRMSHEIRTPMNAIIGMTAIAQNADGLEKAKQCLDKIDNASKHLLGVINDILDMSKIEADRFELSYDEFDFGKMLKDIVNIVNFRIESKQQTFTVNVDEDVPPYIIGDEQRLSQVITNLLANATKFTPDFGIITVNVKKTDEEEGICTLLFEIEDNGIGISPEQQARLFTPFEQGGSIARKYGGTGLGLAISKRIVELMGGSIWIESELGKGSKFVFYIKVKKGSGLVVSAKRTDSLSADNDFSSHTILLAEDVEINSEIIASILEETGITIDIAPNGLEAVKLFQKEPNRYSLILMDVNMPEMDGYDAVRHIRLFDHEKAKTVPIIAMTADVFKEDIERCLEAGMNDHTGKPVDIDDLFSKLNKYLLQKTK